MSDILVQAGSWLLLIFFGSQALIFVALMLWVVWVDAIKPRLIPKTQIEREAEMIIANYPDPEREAFIRQEQAWSRSDGAEQVYWYRVLKAVRRRLKRL